MDYDARRVDARFVGELDANASVRQNTRLRKKAQPLEAGGRAAGETLRVRAGRR